MGFFWWYAGVLLLCNVYYVKSRNDLKQSLTKGP
jgi:hypothetical protein